MEHNKQYNLRKLEYVLLVMELNVNQEQHLEDVLIVVEEVQLIIDKEQ